MKYTQKKKPITSKNKKPLLIVGTVLLLLALGSLFYIRSRGQSPNQTPPVITQPDGEKIDLSPPTEEEKQAVDENKESISTEEKPQNQTPPPVSETVTPFITYAGQYDQNVEVAARISGVYEDNGTCKATFSKGSLSVTRQSKGFKDVRDTLCTPIVVPRSEFTAAGEWTVKVAYTSPSNSGVSEPKKINVE